LPSAGSGHSNVDEQRLGPVGDVFLALPHFLDEGFDVGVEFVDLGF
jgi:hypothetical protein